MSWDVPLSQWLSAWSIDSEVETILADAGVERLLDMCQLTTDDLRGLGIPLAHLLPLLVAMGRGADAEQLSAAQQQLQQQQQQQQQQRQQQQVDDDVGALPTMPPPRQGSSSSRLLAARPRLTKQSSSITDVSAWLAGAGFDERLSDMLRDAGVERLVDLSQMCAEDFETLGVPRDLCGRLADALGEVRQSLKVGELAALEHLPVEPTSDITAARGRKLTNGMI